MVDVRFEARLRRPVTLAAIKAEPRPRRPPADSQHPPLRHAGDGGRMGGGASPGRRGR